MLHSIFVFIFLLLTPSVQSSCCRLPFTNDECQVRRQGPHRYLLMPDRQSGRVMESTECFINDFDANYRQVVETKNYCNDCPGLLVLHTNSSDIFLFPEYLERILEGRTEVQRKNVVILTTGLVGAYDLDFTFLARYYANRRVNEVPSIYVDLQLPPFDSQKETQTSLLLRIPSYNDDKKGSAKISRYELIKQEAVNTQVNQDFHQLPYLYHFDIESHRHSPDLCTLYEVNVTSSTLVWKTLDSAVSTCHTFMPYFGRNKCLASGFTRLFCPIEEDISTEERLQLSPYLKTSNQVEHLTMAVTGGRLVQIAFSNDQIKPAKQAKILLLQGHLTVTDINQNLPIRVEYGRNCNEFGLVVPAGFSATRYRRFDGDNLNIYEGNSLIDLPPCFRVIRNKIPVDANAQANVVERPPSEKIEEDKVLVPRPVPEKPEIRLNLTVPEAKNEEILLDSNITQATVENYPDTAFSLKRILRNENYLAYSILTILVSIALIPLCLGIFYLIYCNDDCQSDWIGKHDSKRQSNEPTIPSTVHQATQTTDTPFRI